MKALNVLTYLLPLTLACNYIPVSKRELDGVQIVMKNYRFKDNIYASTTADAIRHSDKDDGSEKWIFHSCHMASNYDNAQIFALENKKYANTFLYANVASGMSHYTQSLDKVCTVSKRYQWIVYRAECEGEDTKYSLFNLSYAHWLDASDLGLVKHSSCSDNPYSTDSGCDKWKAMEFLDFKKN